MEEAADQLASFNLSNAEAQDEDKESTSLPDDEDPDLWKPHPPREEYPVCLVPLPRLQERIDKSDLKAVFNAS